MHKLDEITGDSEKATEIRRKALEQMHNVSLDNIGKHSTDVEKAMKKNIENMIGCTQIPLGVTRPLKINGEYANGIFNVPLATTEGALVASINRGCKVITEAGGAEVTILDDKMTRAPVFVAPNARKAKEFVTWVKTNFDEIKKVAEEGSNHLIITNIKTWIIGRNVYLRFTCKTGDAMGMNMVTLGVEKACKYIISKIDYIEWISTSGNFCVDKKPAALNFIEGRGKSVIAEIIIPKEKIRTILKTSPKKMAEVNLRKHLVASAGAGSYGFNSHFANMIAAIYIATGQDPAHVVSGSIGFTLCELEGDDLHFSVTLPCVQVGTVGGGTQLGTQKEALELLKINESAEKTGDSAKKLAEIIAATVLAGEISVLGALCEHQLGEAHEKLGRGKKIIR